MNQESIDKITRHVNDVDRIETYFLELSDEEIDNLVNERQENMSVRWTQCLRSFRMLFMAMSRGNKMPLDSFEIKLKQEQIGNDVIETMVRVWRDRRDNSYNVRPFMRNGRIESHEFDAERFNDTYVYRYGTFRSKSAKLSVDHDAPDPTIKLERIEGKLVEGPSTRTKAIFVAALDSMIAPLLEDTENTLILIHQAVLDPTLNPDHAVKLLIQNRTAGL